MIEIAFFITLAAVFAAQEFKPITNKIAALACALMAISSFVIQLTPKA